MKKEANYSVLFMRDDTDVRSFRVSPRRLRTLLWVGGGLGVFALVALIIGVQSFVGYRLLIAEKRELEIKLADAQLTQERAGNIGMMQKALGGKEPAPAPGKPATAQAETAQTGRAFAKVNSGAITVENMRSQVTGGALSTTFDLNNRAGSPLSGEVELLLLRNNGSLAPLEVPAADLTFQIQRFKRIATTAKLPEGVSRRDVLGLRVEIKNSEGEIILGETYSLGN